MKKIIFSLLLLSTFFFLGSERQGKYGSIIGYGRVYADSLISFHDTSLVFDMNFSPNLAEITVISNTSATDSLKIYAGFIRYNLNGNKLDTTWSAPIPIRGLTTWNTVDTTIAISKAKATWFLNVPVIQLLKVSLVNKVGVSGKVTGIIIGAK